MLLADWWISFLGVQQNVSKNISQLIIVKCREYLVGKREIKGDISTHCAKQMYKSQ